MVCFFLLKTRMRWFAVSSVSSRTNRFATGWLPALGPALTAGSRPKFSERPYVVSFARLRLDWFDGHHFQFHGIGAIVDCSLDQYKRVGRNRRSTRNGLQDKLFCTRYKKPLPALLLDTAASADLKLHYSDFRFFQGITNILGLERRSGFVGDHNGFTGQTDFDFVNAVQLSQIDLGNSGADAARNSGGAHRNFFNLSESR